MCFCVPIWERKTQGKDVILIMKIPVDIRLKTESISMYSADDGNTETSDLSFKGDLQKVDNGYIIQYRSNFTDNTIAVFEKMITVNRSGQISSQLVFEEGRSYFGTFSDNINTIQMNTITKHLESKLTEQGGCFLIDYSISYGGTMFERNRVTYTVIPEEGNIAS